MIRSILKEFGGDGLSEEEIVQHGESQGVSEQDARRAIKQLNDAGEIFRTPAGVYKRT